MNRLTRTLALAASLLTAAAGLGACGYVQPPALTISTSASEVPFFTYTADELYADLAEAQGAAGGSTTAPSSYPGDDVAEQLTSKVRPQLVAKALEERSAKPNAADAQSVEAQSQQAPLDPDEAEFQTNVVALVRVLADEFFAAPGNDLDEYARQFYEQRKEQLARPEEVCLHVVSVDATDGQTEPSEEQYAEALPAAQQLRTRLDSEPWETVYADTGQSTQGLEGGLLECRPTEQLPTEIVSAVQQVPVGGISDPMQYRAGWLIVRVDDRTPPRTPTFEEMADQVRDATRRNFGEQFAVKKIEELAKRYHVVVDPRFGRWDPEVGQVLAPGAASKPTVPTTTTTLPPLDEGLAPGSGEGSPTPPSEGGDAPGGDGAPSGTAAEGTTPAGGAANVTTTAASGG